MADTGKMIGLIKALASVDPSAIQSSVEGWLDDHPEATTTVQDGSITKAKLDSSLQQTVDDVGDLKSIVDNTTEIIYGTNLADPSLMEEDTGISGYSVTDYIPVSKGDVVYSTRVSSGTYYGLNDSKMLQIYVYDANKTDLHHYGNFINGTAIAENDATYMKVWCATGWTTGSNVWSLTINNYPRKKADVLVYSKEIVAVDSMVRDGVPYVMPENVLDLSGITLNTVLNSGVPITDSSSFLTDYIPAYYGDIITYSAIFGGVFHRDDIKMIAVGMFDETHTYLGSSSNWVNNFAVNQANTKYIRISVPSAALDYTLVSVTINNKPTKASVIAYNEPHYDADGVPDPVKRSRRVLWLGTSIPTYGYPQILARKCGCTMFNEAIGSSGITSGITSRISTANICGVNSIWGLYGLTQTVAEKETMIENWSAIASEIEDSTELTTAIQNTALASSYETIVDPYLTGDNAVDLVVINHGYNDNTENAIAPSGEELNTHYLEGAYNWLIKHILETNPLINIVIFGHYSDLPASKETALQNVADRWNIPYYLLKNDLGWSSVQTINTVKKVGSSGEWETITATDMTVQSMWLGDGVHPLGVATYKIADVASPVFESWLKMYCD